MEKNVGRGTPKTGFEFVEEVGRLGDSFLTSAEIARRQQRIERDTAARLAEAQKRAEDEQAFQDFSQRAIDFSRERLKFAFGSEVDFDIPSPERRVFDTLKFVHDFGGSFTPIYMPPVTIDPEIDAPLIEYPRQLRDEIRQEKLHGMALKLSGNWMIVETEIPDETDNKTPSVAFLDQIGQGLPPNEGESGPVSRFGGKVEQERILDMAQAFTGSGTVVRYLRPIEHSVLEVMDIVELPETAEVEVVEEFGYKPLKKGEEIPRERTKIQHRYGLSESDHELLMDELTDPEDTGICRLAIEFPPEPKNIRGFRPVKTDTLENEILHPSPKSLPRIPVSFRDPVRAFKDIQKLSEWTSESHWYGHLTTDQHVDFISRLNEARLDAFRQAVQVGKGNFSSSENRDLFKELTPEELKKRLDYLGGKSDRLTEGALSLLFSLLGFSGSAAASEGDLKIMGFSALVTAIIAYGGTRILYDKRTEEGKEKKTVRAEIKRRRDARKKKGASEKLLLKAPADQQIENPILPHGEEE